jgi:hypothetical protein
VKLRLPRPRRPRLRDILGFLLSFVIALIGAVGVILFFESRDEAQLEGGRDVPGRPYHGEPVLSPGLEEAVAQGNVVVLHRDAGLSPGTEELAEGAGPRLRQLGLAVIFEREPTLRTPLGAVADDRIEFGNTPADIRNFVDFHLGP